MKDDLLNAGRAHLSGLLEAVQRCVYFLESSRRKLTWPVDAGFLAVNKRDIDLFESLAAVNERFAKLQDTLASAMRHAALLSGESTDSFLKVLMFYEKHAVIKAVATWQLYRVTRNLAAHDYETDYKMIAEHFNSLNELLPSLYGDASRFVRYCRDELSVAPEAKDFSEDFTAITGITDKEKVTSGQ